MKIRTILVAAIATVILVGLGAKVQVDQWQKATDAAYAQFERDRDARNRQGYDLADWSEARSRETKDYEVLRRLLEKKPFGIPLSAEDENVLEGIRVELARRDP